MYQYETLMTNGFNIFLFSAADHKQILLALFVALTAAKLMAEIFERIRQPAVVGEILAGILIGPSLLPTLHGRA
jgi:Kef-type K+ transport system membrane component KefB